MKKRTAFKTNQEFFNYLVANKKELIEFKKSALKFSDPATIDFEESETLKSLNTAHKDDLTRGKITRTVIGNTYNWMDNHDDVHLNNVFAKTISERQDKIWHLHDHEQKITAKVGKPISIYEKHIAWKDLGVNKDGSTMALFMDSSIQKDYNKAVYNAYLNKEINQHSVAMGYVQIDLAMNDPQQKAEFALWNTVMPLLGNADKAQEQGFFWVVKEARLVEISAVLAGSNELTPTIDNDKADKQVCPNCGEDVDADENGMCPDCGESMDKKDPVSIYTKMANILKGV